MKSEEEIRREIDLVLYTMDHTQDYDHYKFYEGVLIGLKFVLGELSEQKCPDCDRKLVPYALPSDDSGNTRMMCPRCGAWAWKK